MSVLEINNPVPRRILPCFFIIDRSSKTGNRKLEMVVSAIEKVIHLSKVVTEENPDAKIMLSALYFADTPVWLKKSLLTHQEFRFSSLNASGPSLLGPVSIELDKALSDPGFFKSEYGFFPPLFILLTDGHTEDDYSAPFDRLRKNKWFASSVRFAIGLSQYADISILEDFTGTRENIFIVENSMSLGVLIETILKEVIEFCAGKSLLGYSSKKEMLRDEILAVVRGLDGIETCYDLQDYPLDDNWD